MSKIISLLSNENTQRSSGEEIESNSIGLFQLFLVPPSMFLAYLSFLLSSSMDIEHAISDYTIIRAQQTEHLAVDVNDTPATLECLHNEPIDHEDEDSGDFEIGNEEATHDTNPFK